MRIKDILFYKILRVPVTWFLWMKFGYRYALARELPENYIVLANHNTDYDPLMVAASFRRQMYFVGSEHIARWGFVSKLLQFAFSPIMRYKGTLASTTVMEVLRKVRAGCNVCIFAEGARSWDGVTAPILLSTGKLVKSARCGLVTYKIVGGYFVSPNWSQSNTRRGHVRGAVVQVYTAEQLAAMSADEVNAAIARDLHEDAYERQKRELHTYRGRRLAERMENLLFLCPRCGAMDAIRSRDDRVSCSRCSLSFRYTRQGLLEGAPADTVRELAQRQREQVRRDAEAGAVYTARNGVLSTVVRHQETRVAEGQVSLSAQALRCGDREIPFDDILNLAMHGRRALVFSTAAEYFELKPSQEANTLKFMLLYEALKEEKGNKVIQSS